MEHSFYLWLLDVLEPIVDRVWDAYRRVLNLPILAAVVVDGAAGVGIGAMLMGSAAGVGTWLLGMLVLVSSAFFVTASVFTWIGKLRDERDDLEMERLRASGARPLPRGRRAG
jgi:ABC-type transport system involved in cytochrome bd biosynthesis fused ATPase/permease subunit